MTPMDKMLDAIEWTRLTDDDEPRGSVPRAIMHGQLTFGDVVLDVYQLDNGQRVISEESMVRFLQALAGE